VLKPGHNCWRIETATRAAVVIDADAYFTAVREAMLAAEKRIMLIGWDFDARIRIGEEEGDVPPRIGDFILWLAERRPELEIYVLRWDFGAVKALFRGNTALTLLRWLRHPRIHVKLDAMHPPGASHHQKIVVVDDCFAFCGGIDITSQRWDTRDHVDDDPRRIDPAGKPYGAWHDATMAMEGPVAAALGELARTRWRCATDVALPPVSGRDYCWPPSLEPDFTARRVAIARTAPDYKALEECREIEALYIDLVARARAFIYAENQYFASRRIAQAIAARMAELDGPEIVLVCAENADGWLEQVAMDNARARLWQAIRRSDPARRFRIYHPVSRSGAPIYVHAKIMIVDDEVLRVGSSNWNNRSLGLDTECDAVIDAAGDRDTAARITAIRESLMAEHLGTESAAVARGFAETGGLIATIERMRGPGRSLKAYEPPELGAVEKALADGEALDPETPDEMFEPLTKRGLFRRLRRPK